MSQPMKVNSLPTSAKNSLELGVIADDLTGGVKLASLLESNGVHCPCCD